jgi:small conductance mechanosensitive channel
MRAIDYIHSILENWKQALLAFLPDLVLAILVLVAFVVMARVVKRVSLKVYSRSVKTNGDIAKIISSAIYFLLLLAGCFIVLQILGLEKVLTKLIAGAGIIGIIAGFAFKDLAANAFAGLLLNAQQPLKEGDWVLVDSNYGSVLKIGLLTTSLQTNAGQEVFVPNQIIYYTTVSNYTTFRKRCVALSVSVTAAADAETIKPYVLSHMKNMDVILRSEEVNFYYTGINNTAVEFEICFWINFNKENDFKEAASDIIIQVKEQLENEKCTVNQISLITGRT